MGMFRCVHLLQTMSLVFRSRMLGLSRLATPAQTGSVMRTMKRVRKERCFPLLILKDTYHYWNYSPCFWQASQANGRGKGGMGFGDVAAYMSHAFV